MKQTNPLTSKELYRIMALYEKKGNTIREIASIMGKSPQCISYHLTRMKKEGKLVGNNN